MPDIAWLNTDGTPMVPADWDEPLARSVGMWLNGQGIAGVDMRGRRITDDNFIVYFNSNPEAVDVTLPPAEYGYQWEEIMDTAGKHGGGAVREHSTVLSMEGKSTVLLRAWEEPEEEPDASVAASVAASAAVYAATADEV